MSSQPPPPGQPSYPHPPPPGFKRTLWRWSVIFESTFALSMMQPWEKGLIWSTLIIITTLFWLSVFTYYPGHLAYLSRRFAYYVFEDENADLRAIFREWLRDQIRQCLDGVRGLFGMAAGGRVEL
ncbi:hypothetical protein IAR55_001690 [Kwoniella newhampshirensis]|uniref:Uncharacterized protein n=1 Tax=Kwoniella newhampshirensis TaxID=1651941 RepID=A0AAW0Z2V4_9TREE